MTKRIQPILVTFFVIVLFLTAFFFGGRYGWRLLGFQACESAGIEAVTVEEDQVHICGFYPGSFPQGFLGYHAEQVGDTLYVGFRFSGLFGIFETGDFDTMIPTEGSISEVILKTGENEYPIYAGKGDKKPLCP